MKSKIFNYTTINTLILLGFLLIATGLYLTIEKQHNKIIKQDEIIGEQQTLIESTASENVKLRQENENLWNNYYMNVTNQEGYEYYE